MWLHRHLHSVISFAARTYYRVTVAGEAVPGSGPVLLVANHPNSLMDGALVAAATNRPVRFLARAPLFQLGGIAWLIRGTGAIPVYRRDDDPEKVVRNEEMFSAVHRALAEGAVVGIFPEGISHSAPSLAPLKTGAARVALGAAAKAGGTFPILPVGITFRGGKDRFRSEALALVGPPIPWDDLATPEAAAFGEQSRELTRRIHEGLSRVTVNLGSWNDFPVVEGAEAIHAAEADYARRVGFAGLVASTPDRSGTSPGQPATFAARSSGAGDPVRWFGRMRQTAEALQRARELGQGEWEPLARDVTRHMRVLRVLGLRPSDLHAVPGSWIAIRWTVSNIAFFGFALPLAFIGMLLFLPAHQLVVRTEPRLNLPPDRRATYRLLGGAVAGGGWVLILAALLRELVGWRPALWALALLPLLGLLTLRIRDRWRDALADLQRLLLLTGRRDLRARLLDRQALIAARIRALHTAMDLTGADAPEPLPPFIAPATSTFRPESGEPAGADRSDSSR